MRSPTFDPRIKNMSDDRGQSRQSGRRPASTNGEPVFDLGSTCASIHVRLRSAIVCRIALSPVEMQRIAPVKAADESVRHAGSHTKSLMMGT